MDGRPVLRGLSIACATGLLVALLSASAAEAASCTRIDYDNSACGAVSTDRATVSVDHRVAGDGGGHEDEGVPQRPPGISDDIWVTHYCSRPTGCYTIGSPATPAISVRDVESFAPVPGAPRTEPRGWGIRGLPVNAIADPAAVVENAVVLGVAVRVRFAPVSYDWDYGDGSTRTTSTAGSPWNEEFADTTTSHRYGASGAVRLGLRVHYAVAYSLGTEWIPLDGEVIRASNTVPVQIVTERTVLTQ